MPYLLSFKGKTEKKVWNSNPKKYLRTWWRMRRRRRRKAVTGGFEEVDGAIASGVAQRRDATDVEERERVEQMIPRPFPPPLVQSVFRRGKGFVSMFHLHQGYLHEEASWILGWENQRMYMYIKIRPKIKFWILDWEIKECICSAVPLNCLFKCSRRCLKIDDSWINLLLTEFILLSSVF